MSTGEQFQSGTEYEFERLVDGKTRRRIVCFFMVVPEKGFARDMKALEFAAEGKVRSHIHKARLEDINRVFSDLKAGRVDGRVVLDLS